MTADALERIYLLKSSGVADVLRDINAIDEAFRKSAAASNNLAGNANMYDADQLKNVNAQLKEMIGIQNSLLGAVRGMNIEFAKTAPVVDKTIVATEDAIGSMDELTNSAKRLGTNLSGVTPQLLKVQTTFNAGNANNYVSALYELADSLIVLRNESDRLIVTQKYWHQQLKQGVISGEELNAELANLNAQMSVNEKAITDTTRAMQLLNGTYNPELPLEFTLGVKQDSEALLLNAKASQDATAAAIELGIAKKGLREGVNQGVYIGSGQQAVDEEAQLQEMLQEHELYQTKLAEIEDKQQQLSNVAQLERTVKEQQMLDALLAEHELYQTKLAEIEDKQQQLSNVAQLERTVKEQQMLDALLAEHELYQTKLAEIEDKQQGIQRNRMLLNLVDSEAALPENKAGRKVDIQEQRTYVEMIKNQSIALNEEASYYQRLLADVNVLRIAMRGLTEEQVKNAEIGGVLQAKALALDNELRAFNKGVGDSTRDIGKYGLALGGVTNIQTMFLRQLIRGVGSILIFSILFEAITKVGEAIIQAIPGTDAYIQEQEKLKQANEALVKSFEGVIEAIQKEKIALELVSLYDDVGGDKNKGLRKVLDDFKAKAELTKAQGVVDGEVGKADLEQLRTTQEARAVELGQLQDKLKVSEELLRVTEVAQKGITNMKNLEKDGYSATDINAIGQVKGMFGKANLPQKIKDDIYAQIDKFYEDAQKAQGYIDAQLGKPIDLAPIIDKIHKQLIVDNAGIAVEINKNVSDKDVDNEKLDAKNRELVYGKKVELENQLLQLRQTTRQLNEKEDINSVDKIVADTTAKYQVMYITIQKAEDTYIKTYSGDKKNSKYLQTIAMYETLKGDVNTNKDTDISNQKYENAIKTALSNSAFSSQSATTNAGFDAQFANSGYADYSKMAASQDETINAKKMAAENDALHKDQQANDAMKADAYGKDKVQAEKVLSERLKEIYKERDTTLTLIDADAYKARVELGIAFSKRLTENVDAASDNMISMLDNYYMDKDTAILKGKGSDARKEKRVTDNDNKKTIAVSDEIIKRGNADLPVKQGTTQMASGEMEAANQARIDAETTGDKDKIAAATRNLYVATKAYNVAMADQLLLEGKISKAEHDRIIAANALDNSMKSHMKQLANGLLDIAQTLADSYMGLLAKQDAYKAEMAKRSLAWNEKVEESEAESNNQRLTEAKANMLAEQQIERQKAVADKKRAEQSLIINAVIAGGKAIAEDAGDPVKMVIDLGVIAVQTGIQEALLASAPAYAGGFNPMKNMAWVGDGGENELLKISNSFSVSPNKPTLIDATNLQSVTPFSRISNIPGNLGANVKAPSFASNNTQGSRSSDSGTDHTAAFAEIHATLKTVTKGLANIQVSNNIGAANKAAVKLNYMQRRI